MAEVELKEAVEQVGKAFHEFKEANDKNLKERDSLLETKLNKINAELNKYEDYNQKLTLAQQQNAALAKQMEDLEATFNRAGVLGKGLVADKEAQEYRDNFESQFLRTHPNNRDGSVMAAMHKRMNTLIKGDDAGAGYLMAPPEMQAEIVKDIVLMSPMRALATVRKIGRQSLKIVRKTGTGSATRVGEIETRSDTTDPQYGITEILAPAMHARVPVSLEALEDSEYDLIAELREDSSEQFAVKEGQEFISGAGANNQAEGILTNASVAEVVSGNATLIKADGLISLWTALKDKYTRNANFTLNRATLGEIRKLKDGNGQYLWVPGLAGNVPNTILNSPYVEMPDMPNIGAGLYPVAYGDFKKAYVVVDRIAISFMIDYLTGAGNGLVYVWARKRVGGGVRQAEAIKKLKIAAS